ncbi:MAG TPA: DUF1302 family protein [Candidatus Binatia bacterium]
MGPMQRQIIILMVMVHSIAFLFSHVSAASILGDDWAGFFKEKVTISGFVENTSGIATGHGDSNFNTSNRFIMNRFTLQPEININFAEQLKFFISWRFVGEPRYSSETKSRRATVQPAGSGQPLPVDFYSEYKGIPWEAVADISPTDRLQIRLGRQFISWGETDGLRILDLIDPQDNTIFTPAAPNLFSLEETRIPQWGIRMLYTVRPVSNTILEFFANPGWEEKKKRVDDVSPGNDISDGHADGDLRFGRWSVHPETRIASGRLFANPLGTLPVVVPVARREYPDAGDSWKVGARITHNFGELNAGVGYIWGYNPQGLDMVFKRESTPFLLGPPSPGTPTGIRLKLVNDRTNIFAAHLNYPVGEPLGIPIKSALRGELAFYPDKPYNISEFPGRNCVTGAPTGLIAGPSCKHPSNIVEKHTLRYSIGLDRSTFIPFLQDDPWRPFRMSLQLFQSVIFDHEDGIRNFFNAGKIKRYQSAITFRVGTGYFGDTILPDFFMLYEPLGNWVFNPAITYAPSWNENIRISLIGAIYDGNKFTGITGFFTRKDSVFLQMRYQF